MENSEISLSLRQGADIDVMIAVQSLVDAEILIDRDDVIAFMEKPWKWETEIRTLGFRLD